METTLRWLPLLPLCARTSLLHWSLCRDYSGPCLMCLTGLLHTALHIILNVAPDCLFPLFNHKPLPGDSCCLCLSYNAVLQMQLVQATLLKLRLVFRYLLAESEEALYVAFIGTKQRRDIMTNANIMQQPLWPDSSPSPSGQVGSLAHLRSVCLCACVRPSTTRL